METITFGRRAGQAAAEHALMRSEVAVSDAPLAAAERDLGELLDRTDGERPWKIRDELGSAFQILELHEFRFDEAPGVPERFLGWSCLVEKR